MTSLNKWLLAARPKTLTASVAPVMTATSLAYYLSSKQIAPQPSYQLSLWALLSSLCIQIGTNFVNDAQDFKKGTDTEKRLGPKRVTQSGQISYQNVMRGAAFVFFVAFLFGFPLIAAGSWTILSLGLVSILAAYAYTAGPYPLAYNGLGEIFVLLFFGIASLVGLGYLLGHNQFHFSYFIAGLQLGCLCTNLLVINNARDIHEDRANNKMTLAARWGLKFARYEIFFFFAGAYLLCFYWIQKEMLMAGLLPFLTLPLAIVVLFKTSSTPPSQLWNKFLAISSLILLAFSFLLSLGFYWEAK